MDHVVKFDYWIKCRDILIWNYFYFSRSESVLVEYADTNYLFDPHKVKLQTWYVVTGGGTIISQTLTVTSSNHSKIIAIHKSGRDCVWLKN